TVAATNAAGVTSFLPMFVVVNQPLTTTSYSAGTTPNPLNTNVASGTTKAVLNLSDGFNDPNASNVIVKLSTSDGPVYVQLFAATPQTTDNFLAYINSGAYNSSIFSRMGPEPADNVPAILQGGNYQLSTTGTTNLTKISTLSTINSEVGIASN